jgi:hypothetical protein
MRRVRQSVYAAALGAAAIVISIAVAMAQGGAVAIYEEMDGPPEAGDKGVYRRVGGMVTDGGSTQILCPGGDADCEAGPCTGCHTTDPASKTTPAQYSATSATRHFTNYFPKVAVPVAANSRVTFGSRTVTMQNGRLVTIDRNGKPRLRLPSGAMVIRTTRLQPMIVYPGSAMPEVVK